MCIYAIEIYTMSLASIDTDHKMRTLYRLQCSVYIVHYLDLDASFCDVRTELKSLEPLL